MPEKKKRFTGETENKEGESCKKDPDQSTDDFKSIASIIYESDNIHDTKQSIISSLDKIIKESPIADKYTLLFLYDPYGDILPYTANRIYNALPKNKEQDILLVIHSSGGQIEPAYLISKCCKEFSKKFVVSIPRKAKSAATLISLGAHEIHMGIMSELGPIDPQFGGLPALGLSSAVEYLAGLCKRHPESSDMLAKYLSLTLDLRTLGYFERVSESAMQYAQRLLDGKVLPENQSIYSVAAAFVYAYKDHSFVIDKEEARNYLGDAIIADSEEYQLGNNIHNLLESVTIFADIFKQHKFSMVGSCDDLLFTEKKKS